MSYENKLLRLNKLLLAQNAIREAVQIAIEDVVGAAVEEPRAPAKSGTLPRFDPKAIAAADASRAVEVEHLVMLAWTNARDDDERERVRTLVRASISRRLLTADAEERLLSLAG